MKTLKYIFLSFLITLIISCNKKEKYSDEEVCLLMSKMEYEDQKLRNLPEVTKYILNFQHILDSIKSVRNLTNRGFDSLSEYQQNKINEVAKNILDNSSKNNWDSIIGLQAQIDKRNTEKLIDIVSHKGWPDKEKLKCTEFGAPVLIFRHAPQEYFDTIRSIIKKEYAENRMGDGDYMFIENHLEGRPMFNFETKE